MAARARSKRRMSLVLKERRGLCWALRTLDSLMIIRFIVAESQIIGD